MKYSFTELIDEKRTNIIITRICLWVTLVFVVNLFFTLPGIGFYNGWVDKIIIWSCIGSICTISPYILRELEINPSIIKYYTITICYIFLCIMSSFKEAYPVLAFLLPIVLSCLYYKRRLTFITVAIGLVSDIYSKYLFSKFLNKMSYVAGDHKLGMISSVIQFIVLACLMILLAVLTESIVKSIKSDRSSNSRLQEARTKADWLLKKLAIYFITTGHFTKYMIITLCTVYTGFLHANPPLNVDIFYLFPIILSCLFFDKRLTIYTFILSIINIIVSDYFYFYILMLRGFQKNINTGYYPDLLSYILDFLVVALPVLYLSFRNETLVKSWRS